MSMQRLRSALKRTAFRLHRQLLRLGIVILPRHYYIQHADVRELSATRAEWARASELPGLRTDLDDQVRRLAAVCEPYRAEYADNRHYNEAVRGVMGPGFGPVEAQALHAVVRHYRPQRVIEVGGGVSTYCTRAALRLNAAEGAPGRITCIEPFPSRALQTLADVDVIASRVQSVPLDVFRELRANDVLFVDSTHTVRPGSDVNHIVLEVLPRLATGVIVHFHDIYLPFDYPREVLQGFNQWSETSLVRAFLINNSRAEILFCLSHLHYERPDALEELFPGYVPEPGRDGLAPEDPSQRIGRHFPASLWFRIVE